MVAPVRPHHSARAAGRGETRGEPTTLPRAHAAEVAGERQMRRAMRSAAGGPSVAHGAADVRGDARGGSRRRPRLRAVPGRRDEHARRQRCRDPLPRSRGRREQLDADAAVIRRLRCRRRLRYRRRLRVPRFENLGEDLGRERRAEAAGPVLQDRRFEVPVGVAPRGRGGSPAHAPVELERGSRPRRPRALDEV